MDLDTYSITSTLGCEECYDAAVVHVNRPFHSVKDGACQLIDIGLGVCSYLGLLWFQNEVEREMDRLIQ